MPGFVHLIKARNGTGESAGGPLFSFAWAGRVRRMAGRIHAENIQVPVVSWRDEGWHLEGHRLPDKTFAGHAHPCRRPDWFASDSTDAKAATTRSRRAAVEEKLRTTPLGRLCLHPEVRLALAQDQLAATVEPLLRIPDLLAGEDELAEAWRRERPAAAAQAAAAAALSAPVGGAPAEETRWRRRLRVAALRRLDAAAVGREVFFPCPAYLGEPYLALAVTPKFSCKAGLVRRMQTWPGAESEAKSRTWRADPELVAAMERRLFPVLAAAGANGVPASALAPWRALAPLREFETRSPWPLFPRPAGDDPAPAGFRVRIRPETMRGLGGSYRTLARAGLSPYLAEEFGDYCATQGELLAGWTEDPAGLALAKWGGG